MNDHDQEKQNPTTDQNGQQSAGQEAETSSNKDQQANLTRQATGGSGRSGDTGSSGQSADGGSDTLTQNDQPTQTGQSSSSTSAKTGSTEESDAGFVGSKADESDAYLKESGSQDTGRTDIEGTSQDDQLDGQ